MRLAAAIHWYGRGEISQERAAGIAGLDRTDSATLRIPVRGALALVLAAKQRGMVDRARPLLERLRRAGMYLSDEVMERALKKIGE